MTWDRLVTFLLKMLTLREKSAQAKNSATPQLPEITDKGGSTITKISKKN